MVTYLALKKPSWGLHHLEETCLLLPSLEVAFPPFIVYTTKSRKNRSNRVTVAMAPCLYLASSEWPLCAAW